MIVACVGGDDFLIQCERLEAQLKACVLPPFPPFPLRHAGVQVARLAVSLVLFLPSLGK